MFFLHLLAGERKNLLADKQFRFENGEMKERRQPHGKRGFIRYLYLAKPTNERSCYRKEYMQAQHYIVPRREDPSMEDVFVREKETWQAAFDNGKILPEARPEKEKCQYCPHGDICADKMG